MMNLGSAQAAAASGRSGRRKWAQRISGKSEPDPPRIPMPPPVGSAALAIDAAPLVLQPRAAGTRRFARDWLRWRRLDLAADRAVRSPRARVPMPEPKSGAGRRKPRRAGIAPTEGPPETLSSWPVPAPSDRPRAVFPVPAEQM